MTEKQSAVLNFWCLEKRGMAVFEGKLITEKEIKEDAELAARYWDQQLFACHENFVAARPKGHY